ncbi:MFS general substrate transporter [Trametopsis cervina]|nr:MFS general substrate transporter [Trametopsis cervina]
MSTLVEHGSIEQKPQEHAQDVNTQPRSLAVPAGGGIRRRGSDSNRTRPTNLTEDIELSTIGSTSVAHNARSTGAKSSEDLKQTATSDVEHASIITLGRSTTNHSATNGQTQEPTASQRRWRLLHYSALCYTFWLAGWNDSSIGPLLPTIQRAHHIGFAIVSLLFVTNVAGYLVGSLANVSLTDRWGIGKLLAVGSLSQLTGYAILASGGPFPLMCTGFAFTGLGSALTVTQCNSYVGSLKEGASTKLGFMHSLYGLGALISPLVATQFAQQVHWSFHYLISTSLGLINFIALCAVFRFKVIDALREECGHPLSELSTKDESKYKQIFKLPAVHFLSFWTLIYVGIEVTLSGWIVTFLQQKRDGGASTGYISSGFFGGLMLGRIGLIWLNQKIGEHRVMFIYASLAIALEVTVWVVPSLIENAIAVAFIGLTMGPMYPILIHHSSVILPKWLYTGAIGWVSGIGQTGSAVLPFLTGLLASKFGITALQPFLVSMMSTLIVIWALVPRVRRFD